MASEGNFVVPAGRRLSRVDSKTLRESFSGSASAEMEAVMRNIARKDDKIKYNRRMRVVLAAAVGVMVIMVGAMFAVTLSANEASKESHVTGGVMTSLSNEAVKTDAVKSYGNILGFPCLPMSILQRMDEVSLEVKVPTTVASDGLLQVVLKVGTVERSVTDKFVTVTSPSDNQMLTVEEGIATYKDRETCKDGCEVIVEIDVSTGRRLTQSTKGTDRSLTEKPPTGLATFAVFNMFAKVFKQACGAFKTVGDMCKVLPKEVLDGPMSIMCRDIAKARLDDKVRCDEPGTGSAPVYFQMKEILEADDVKAAYDKVNARCQSGINDGKRALKGVGAKKGRHLLVDYGWCSSNLGFILSITSDSSNFCDSAQSCDSWGGCGDTWNGNHVSQCCIAHDECLQNSGNAGKYGHSGIGSRRSGYYSHQGIGRNALCGNKQKCGETCDLELSSCANSATCSYRDSCRSCGWRGCRSYSCWSTSTYCQVQTWAVKTSMAGVKPNKNNGFC